MFRTFFALALWLVCVPVWATPARVTGWFTDTAGPLTVSTTAGDALCVFFVSTGAGTVTISDNASGGSSTYANVPAANAAFGGGGNVYSYYALNTKGATSLSVAISGQTIEGIWVDEYSGVATSSALDGTGAAQEQATLTTSGTWTTSSNGDLVCGGTFATNTTIVVGSGFTLGNDDHANGNLTEYLVQSTASAATAITTNGGADGIAAGFALKASGGAAGTYHSLLMQGVGK